MVSATVPAGGSLTTDVESDGTSPSDAVELEVTSPNAGTIEITRFAGSSGTASGFQLLGIDLTVVAPDASVADPLVLVFDVDASLIPPGGAALVRILRDGVPVPDCTGAPQAIPDPCESSRSGLPGGGLRLTILTSSVTSSGAQAPGGGGGAAVSLGLAPIAAVWSVGVPLQAPVGPAPAPALSPALLLGSLLLLVAIAALRLRRGSPTAPDSEN